MILLSAVTNGLARDADCAEALVTVFGHEGGYQNSKHDGDIPDPVAMNINATTVPILDADQSEQMYYTTARSLDPRKTKTPVLSHWAWARWRFKSELLLNQTAKVLCDRNNDD